MAFSLTNKQDKFLRSKGARINILTGSVRSGKTYVSLLKWGLWVASMPKDGDYIMVGKTVGSLRRNCFGYLTELFGDNFQFTISTKTALLFGRFIYLEGANDERAEQKIRGMTLTGAYCDEVTLFPESFFSMLLSRLSVQGAKLWATCNPDVPSHYIKEKYIDRADELDEKVWNFALDENTFLPDEYLANLKSEFSGVFYNRFVLGQWVRAEGIIYGNFANNVDEFYLPPNFNYRDIIQVTIGIDFGGNKSGTSFVCTGFTRGLKDVIILEAEKHSERLSPTDLDRHFVEFCRLCLDKYHLPMYVYCDSAEQILIEGLRGKAMRQGLNVIVKNARKMPILDRIMLVNRLTNQRRFWVAKHCQCVVKALCEAVWDEKHENERLDDFTSDIDTLDAMEYSLEYNYKGLMAYSPMGGS